MASLPPDAFAAKLASVASHLRGLARVAAVGIIDGMERIAESAVAHLKDRTPVDAESSGPHIADGWVAQKVEAPGMLIIDVVNAEPRANAPISLLGGGETSLLQILEYGSEAHEIVPRNPGGVLVFLVGGRKIFTKHVSHPGTRPYAMVATTEAEVSVEVKKIIDATRRLLRMRLTGRI